MEEQVIETFYFLPNFIMPCIPLRYAQTCAAQYIAQFLLTKTLHYHKQIRFITR